MTQTATPWQPSRAAIGGHPIHPMLVPFPIGLLSAAAGTDLAYLLTRDRFWARASKWLLGTGLAAGAMAAPFGSIDFWSIRRARRGPEGWIHLSGNVAVLLLTTANVAIRVRDGEEDAIDHGGAALSMVVGGLLLVTGWMGGELAYRKMVGVAGPEPLPVEVDVERSVVGG